jgi:metal-responsive CopG/Arc/MetJ family transcriptional regulator
MGRPKLKETEKKGKIGITLSKSLINHLDEITNNKSKFIETLLEDYLYKKHDTRRT